jgi:hypothetical protein
MVQKGKTVADAGCLRARAMRRASVTNSSSSVAPIAHPTTRREYKSSTTARYSYPSVVEIIVQSVTHLVFGAEAAKSRFKRFGAKRADRSLFAAKRLARFLG